MIELMNKKSLLSVCTLSVISLGSAMLVLKAPVAGQYLDKFLSASDNLTLSLAPLSLGNPTMAATLQSHLLLHPSAPVLPVTSASLPPADYEKKVKAGRGDTLAKLLSRAGVSRSESQAAIQALSKVFNPRKFRQGQSMDVKFRLLSLDSEDISSAGEKFAGLSFEPDIERIIRVTLTPEGRYVASEARKLLSRRLTKGNGIIKSSLYLASRKAGLPNDIISELIRAYSWDVDFQRDIRRDDKFDVMYEEILTKDGQFVKGGDLTYATLTLSGKQYTIYRYTDLEGHTNYYDARGRSARKALMRTPIDGARLSSGYGRRRHPVLGYTKMHKGVDFAAARGTPFYAAGDGTVTYAARKGAYGNFISIRHNSEYTTAYAHLKGFARGIRKGKRVRQGQVIGYVGTTGRSTGPHLHYEIRRSGRQTNPLRVKMPSGKTLNSKEMALFQQRRLEIDRQYADIPVPQEMALLDTGN